MRNGLIGLGIAVALASTMAASACSDYSDGGTAATVGGSSTSGGNAPVSGGQSSTIGGSSATGGSPSGVGGGTATCANVNACGGSVVGTWTAASSCLKVSGKVDMSMFGLGCSSADVTGSLQVTGTFTANTDGTFKDNTTTSGTEVLTLASACLNISGTVTSCDRLGSTLPGLGYSSVTCKTAASGGGCTCDATVEQTGGMGVVVPASSTSGTYTVSGNQLLTSDGVENTPNDYCVAANKLTVTPKPANGPTLTGSIVLQK